MYLNETHLREVVRSMVNEALIQLTEKEEEKRKTSKKRKQVLKMLQDPKYNHAQLAYKLYKPQSDSEKDTARSLFSKKVTGKPDADGAVRSFSDEEVSKLYTTLKGK